jgi:hypothetical protein
MSRVLAMTSPFLSATIAGPSKTGPELPSRILPPPIQPSREAQEIAVLGQSGTLISDFVPVE